MKKRRITNRKLTSERDQQKKHIIRGVVKRGTNPQLKAAGRNVWRTVKALCKCAVVAALGYGAWLAYDKLFWRNPDYALSDIAFSSDGSLARDQALAVTALKPGRNIYDYNLDAAREALRALPQVENVEVHRYLPNRIEIAVTERKPVAWVTNDAKKDERTHLLDARGLVFRPKRVLPEYEMLPVISGVELGDLVPGKPISKFELVAALELLRLSHAGGDTQILSIDVSKGYCLITTDQRHARVTFGLDDIAQQLDSFSKIRREAADRLMGEIESVNLMVQNNVPVTFVQPPPEDTGGAGQDGDAVRPRIIGAEPSSAVKNPSVKTSTKGGDKSDDKPERSPKGDKSSKPEPSRTKDSPKGRSVLKQFRRTA